MKKASTAESIEFETATPTITSAYVHEALVIPGSINTEKTLNSQKLPGIKLSLEEHAGGCFLKVTHKGRSALVPSQNVAFLIIE